MRILKIILYPRFRTAYRIKSSTSFVDVVTNKFQLLFSLELFVKPSCLPFKIAITIQIIQKFLYIQLTIYILHSLIIKLSIQEKNYKLCY